MTRILLLLFILFFATGCASVEVPDFKAHTTLPASKKGFWIKTVTPEEGEISPEEWEKQLATRPFIIIFAEDYRILRSVVVKNCLSTKCKDLVGTFDGLFYALDNALKQLPKK